MGSSTRYFSPVQTGSELLLRRLLVAVVATTFLFLAGVSSSSFAAKGSPGKPDDGGGGGAATDLGDLIILYRDDNGVPIPSPVVDVTDPETGLLVDGGQCWQPIAFNVEDTDLCPAECVVDALDENGDPDDSVAVVSVNQFSCGVGAIDEATGLTVSCANCTQEVDFGRINAARAPDDVFDRQLEDVVVNLSIADCTTLDPAGRLVASIVDDTTPDNLAKTIDSPLQNLAIYRDLMLTGSIGPELPEGADTLDTAARGLGAASDKSGGVNVDLVAYLNQIMGLSDPATTTVLGKLCETYREEVEGTIQLVERCYLNYGDYAYTRETNFGGLPDPAYIPEGVDTPGWFEYLAVLDPQAAAPQFQIDQGPIQNAVFCFDEDENPLDPVSNQACTSLPLEEPTGDVEDYTGGNIGAFAQAADDARAVISFMHFWQVPVDYETAVPCEASGGTAYDVSISEESGLKVPMTYVNGTDREFIVTVANAGPDAATGTVTVTAVQANGAAVPGSPWDFEFTDLGKGFSASFTTALMFDLGTSTTITWTATVEAEDDVNLNNNTVTATTSVRNTGGGGGNGNKP